MQKNFEKPRLTLGCYIYRNFLFNNFSSGARGEWLETKLTRAAAKNDP